MKVTLLKTLLAAGLLLGAVRPASATLVTIYLEGVVDYVEDEGNYLEGKINVGDPITGHYTYDTATADSLLDDPIVGHYWHYNPPAGIALIVGEFTFASSTSSPEFLLGVTNRAPGGGADIYWVASQRNLPLSNGSPVDDIAWQLTDPSGTALNSDAPPAGPPDLSEWKSELYNLWIDGERTYGIQGHITSAVPEPATFLFVFCGSVIATKLALKRR